MRCGALVWLVKDWGFLPVFVGREIAWVGAFLAGVELVWGISLPWVWKLDVGACFGSGF